MERSAKILSVASWCHGAILFASVLARFLMGVKGSDTQQKSLAGGDIHGIICESVVLCRKGIGYMDIQELEKKKQEAIANEDYAEAKRLKEMIDNLQNSDMGGRLAEINEQIKQAIANGDYAKASHIYLWVQPLAAKKPLFTWQQY